MSEGTAIVETFLEKTEEEAPKLARGLARVVDEARPALAEILARFDGDRSGALDEGQRELARRVLALLHRPSARGLEMMQRVLDYLDVDDSRALEHRELVLAVEVLELFCKADSVNQTLSVKELEMLHAVLEHLDTDQNGKLDPDERSRLRDELWDPNAFLEAQKQDNPKLRELLGR